MSLIIRKAEISDAEGIAAVAASLQIGDERPPLAGQTGFLLWAQSPATYGTRLACTKHFVVAEAGSRIVGFLMAYSLEELTEISRSMSYEDQVLKNFGERYSNSTIYPDQIGVLPSHKRQGIGGMMDDKLQELAPNVGCATVIGHAPIRNNASIAYFTSRGYSFAQELQQDDWTLGLYERNVILRHSMR